MIPPVNSLVRYDNPILVATSKGKKGDGPKAPAAVSQTEDILNSILPPRYKPKESHKGWARAAPAACLSWSLPPWGWQLARPAPMRALRLLGAVPERDRDRKERLAPMLIL